MVVCFFSDRNRSHWGRPKHWHITSSTCLSSDSFSEMSQKFGLGLGLELLASASASKLSGLSLEVLASASRHSGHYRTSSLLPEPGTDEPSKHHLHQLRHFRPLYCDFSVLQPLLDRLFWQFCIPASSAPVERVFSQSNLIMTARRACMSNAVLE